MNSNTKNSINITAELDSDNMLYLEINGQIVFTEDEVWNKTELYNYYFLPSIRECACVNVEAVKPAVSRIVNKLWKNRDVEISETITA